MIIIPIVSLIKLLKNKNKVQYENNYPDNYINYKYTDKKYKIKTKYISNCEQEFYNEFKSIIKDKYIIFPQVPLSQIVNKTQENTWQNELFRIIDFCIFTKDYYPLVCIEINDNTHHEKKRYIRDKKVQAILNEAGIPLITLWTEYGVNPIYIKERLQKHLAI